MRRGMEDPAGFRHALLAWYADRRRDLPWRHTSDPYAILVAEVLLQQTRVETGEAYYRRLLERFPSVESLADAQEEEVLRVWEGLGYYRRARHLHRAAQEIVAKHEGRVPRDPEVLESLPGVGPYTAGAVASIAYGVPVPAVDGNVTRVVSRLYAVEEDVTRTTTQRRIRRKAADLVPAQDPGAFNQALMDLGAQVCLPRRPRCAACPVTSWCEARSRGVEGSLPRTPRRKEVPTVAAAFALVEREGRILLVRREADDLLGGLWALPGGELRPDEVPEQGLRRLVREQCGAAVRAEAPVGSHRHTFSHRRWAARAFRCRLVDKSDAGKGRWVPREELADLPLVPFHRDFLDRSADPSLDDFA